TAVCWRSTTRRYTDDEDADDEKARGSATAGSFSGSKAISASSSGARSVRKPGGRQPGKRLALGLGGAAEGNLVARDGDVVRGTLVVGELAGRDLAQLLFRQ